MFTVRRWWDRYGLQIILVGTALGTAWILRQTQAAPVVELYGLITRPFASEEAVNRELQLSNAKFEELNTEVRELKQQNQQLQQLLGYVQKSEQPSIVAPIVGRSADYWWQQITIGRGSSDGIKVGYAVASVGGLVGRVTQVTPHTSRILLVSDYSSRVGVSISRSRDLGYLEGQGSDRAVMRFFEKVPDVKPGDVVTTSQVSRLFPGGLPIGHVKSVEVTKGPSPEAIVELSAPLNHIEWVVVHPFEAKDL